MSSAEVKLNIAEFIELAEEYNQAKVFIPSKWIKYQGSVTALLVLLSMCHPSCVSFCY